MTVSQKLSALAEGMPKLVTAGKDWVFAHMTQPSGLFYRAAFPENSDLEVSLPQCGGVLTDMFRMVTGLDTLRLTVPEGMACKVNYFVYNSSIRVLQLPAVFPVSDFTSFAGRCSRLEEIWGQLDLSASAGNDACFNSCTVLREVRFLPESIYLSISFKQSGQLSAESVASIVEGLAQVETPQILSLHDTVKNALTQTQRTAIEAKNWTLE